MYDIKSTKFGKIEEVLLSISHENLEIKSEYYWLKKTKNARINGFIFNEIVKLTV